MTPKLLPNSDFPQDSHAQRIDASAALESVYPASIEVLLRVSIFVILIIVTSIDKMLISPFPILQHACKGEDG